jgi:hypothetical protein
MSECNFKVQSAYPACTITAGRGRLEGSKTIGPPSATACGLQDLYPPARIRAEGGSCSAANSVPMVNRLFADCADREPLLGQLCLIWLNVAMCVSCMHYYLYTVQSWKLEPNPVRCQDIVELLNIVFPWVCGGLTYPECTVNKHIFMQNNNANQITQVKYMTF